MAFIAGPALPASRSARPSLPAVCMSAAGPDSQPRTVSRRQLLSRALAAAALLSLPASSRAEREYANVGYLGGSDTIDINNANVRAYQKFRGFYPNLAAIIVSNGPYTSVDELYKLPGITPAMKASLDEYKTQLVALEPAPEYVIDRINNGLYR